MKCRCDKRDEREKKPEITQTQSKEMLFGREGDLRGMILRCVICQQAELVAYVEDHSDLPLWLRRLKKGVRNFYEDIHIIEQKKKPQIKTGKVREKTKKK